MSKPSNKYIASGCIFLLACIAIGALTYIFFSRVIPSSDDDADSPAENHVAENHSSDLEGTNEYHGRMEDIENDDIVDPETPSLSDSDTEYRDINRESVARFSENFAFQDYSAPVYDGEIRLSGAIEKTDQLSVLKPKILDAYSRGIDFAGDMITIPIGCGTGCNYLMLGSAQTGEVFPEPFGEEEIPNDAEYEYIKSSSLMRIRYRHSELSPARCVQEFYDWDGKSMKLLSSRAAFGQCP